MLVQFGEVLASTLEEHDKRLSVQITDMLIAYGYAPESGEYDELVMRLIKEDRLEELLKLDERFIEKAKPDSF